VEERVKVLLVIGQGIVSEPEHKSEREARIELMCQRVELGLDLWTGQPLKPS